MNRKNYNINNDVTASNCTESKIYKSNKPCFYTSPGKTCDEMFKNNTNNDSNKKEVEELLHNQRIIDDLLNRYYNNSTTAANQITKWTQFEDLYQFNYPKYRENYTYYLSTLSSNWSYKDEFDDSEVVNIFINKTLVRQQNSKSIWLIKNNELHLIDNIALFIKLGFDFSDVVVIEEKFFNIYRKFHLGSPCTLELCS